MSFGLVNTNANDFYPYNFFSEFILQKDPAQTFRELNKKKSHIGIDSHNLGCIEAILNQLKILFFTLWEGFHGLGLEVKGLVLDLSSMDIFLASILGSQILQPFSRDHSLIFGCWVFRYKFEWNFMIHRCFWAGWFGLVNIRGWGEWWSNCCLIWSRGQFGSHWRKAIEISFGWLRVFSRLWCWSDLISKFFKIR